ncbi:hypothetical protein ACK32R_04655 [Aeromonas dhakensis]|jgi:hypothetical protein|uniref:hypothetical protein n=1 Tax=Aeromonas dhakensis TaxID=196024 RepID=UPI00398651FC
MKIKSIPLVGTVTTREQHSVKKEFKIGNVMLPDTGEYPKGGITFYYGAKTSSTNALSLAYQRAAESNHSLVQVEIETKVMCPIGPLLTKEDLPNSGFMHIERIEREVADLIRPLFIRFMNHKGLPKQNIASIRTLAMAIARNPEFIGYLHQDESFSHIDVIAYPVIEDGAKSVRATLFSTKNVVRESLFSPSYELSTFVLDQSMFSEVPDDIDVIMTPMEESSTRLGVMN